MFRVAIVLIVAIDVYAQHSADRGASPQEALSTVLYERLSGKRPPVDIVDAVEGLERKVAARFASVEANQQAMLTQQAVMSQQIAALLANGSRNAIEATQRVSDLEKSVQTHMTIEASQPAAIAVLQDQVKHLIEIGRWILVFLCTAFAATLGFLFRKGVVRLRLNRDLIGKMTDQQPSGARDHR